MAFDQLPLPYDYDALEPHISERTMHFHYDKHHKGYVDKLNELTKGTEFEKRHLLEVITQTYGVPEHQAIYNNAAQTWNHTIFWSSMAPPKSGSRLADEPQVAELIDRGFGSFKDFKEEFVKTSVGRFGSGYTWLVLDDGNLKLFSLPNADTPLNGRTMPLLNCDLWEHTYYLDYQNQRAAFVEAFVDNLINWNAVKLRLLAPDPSALAEVA